MCLIMFRRRRAQNEKVVGARLPPKAAPKGLLDLPYELRAMIYAMAFEPEPAAAGRCLSEYHLLMPGNKPRHDWAPVININRNHKLAAGLLHVNRAIREEATSIFFANVRFDFSAWSWQDLEGFFERIGPRQAGLIRHIQVDMPAVEWTGSGFEIRETDVEILRLLQLRLGKVKSLVIAHDQRLSDRGYTSSGTGFERRELATLACHVTNRHFRALPSLEEIRFEDVLKSFASVQSVVLGLGWTEGRLQDIPNCSFSLNPRCRSRAMLGPSFDWRTCSDYIPERVTMAEVLARRKSTRCRQRQRLFILDLSGGMKKDRASGVLET